MFTQEQLSEIRYAARKTKNQGELAVYNRLLQTDLYHAALSETQWRVVKYCAEECKRQRSGEMSVYNMVNAWDYAMKDEDWLLEENTLHLTLPFIERIGKIVEPIDNKKGFRTIPIGVWNKDIWYEKADWREVPRLLTLLLESYYEGYLTAEYHPITAPNGSVDMVLASREEVFYRNYENIHPFVDGNGRSGKILLNYLCGTLDNPIMPPNFWGGSNP